MFNSSVESISVHDVPLCPDRVASDREALQNRALGSSQSEILCPGGCGGRAALESPMKVTRQGVTRTVQVARCLGECRTEVKSKMGKTRLMPSQFEIVIEEGAEAEVAENELSAQLKVALMTSGIRQAQAAVEIGCSQSVISKILHGYPVAEKTAEAARLWALQIMESRELEPQEPTVEIQLSKKAASITPKRLEASPYETIIRRLLEEVAQKKLEELAGEAAQDVVVRVYLEWADRRESA